MESQLLVSFKCLGPSVLMECESSSMVFLFCLVNHFSPGDTGYRQTRSEVEGWMYSRLLHELRVRG